ncbi:MAG: histidine kinase [Cytophagales bacterium]|nr:histidine kinase [Cytophagales bacterium]
MFSVKYRYGFILLLAVYSYLNIQFTVGEKLFDAELTNIHLFGVLSSVVLLIWEFNRLVEINLPRIATGFLKKVHPLIILFFVSMLNVAIACFITLFLLDIVLIAPLQYDFTHTRLLLAFGFRVNLFLNCVNAIVFYMNRLKQTQLEAEQLKKESIEAQFEALRSQVNPHFMFNCFNVLSNLVYKDPDTSSKFIAQLSNVYRYLLQSQQKKVVTLQEELSFIESYLYLLKMRHGENLVIEKKLEANSDNFYVAPASLQMLIENAIKHNIVSKNNPLTIRLYTHNGSIVVSNNLQEKEFKEESTQRGLQNIQSRYRLLSDEQVVIEKLAQEFRVTIPLLQLQ